MKSALCMVTQIFWSSIFLASSTQYQFRRFGFASQLNVPFSGPPMLTQPKTHPRVQRATGRDSVPLHCKLSMGLWKRHVLLKHDVVRPVLGVFSNL